VGLAEPAEQLYQAVLDQSCLTLVQVVKQLPAFTPRALAELLERSSEVMARLTEVLDRLPRTTLDAPRGSEDDAEFRLRYLAHISETLDELEQFGLDVRRYQPRTLVSVAYLSLQVSTGPGRRGRGERPEERWFTDSHRSVPTGSEGSSSLRVEAALAEAPRTLLRGEAGSGKTTLLQWLAVTAARSGFSGPLAECNGFVPFLVRLRSYADRALPRPEQLLAGVADPLVESAAPGLGAPAAAQRPGAAAGGRGGRAGSRAAPGGADLAARAARPIPHAAGGGDLPPQGR
jgi:NACHT domain